MRVYADNAATTRINPNALKAMQDAQKQFYANPSSMHQNGREAAEALAKARKKISDLLGCLSDELVFTSGGSEADNQAIRSVACLGAERGKRHIITTNAEHPAVLKTLESLKPAHFEIQILPVNSLGYPDPERLKQAIRRDTALVSCMYVNNEIGTVSPIKRLGGICRKNGVIFHTDAVQAVGHMPVDLSSLPVDMMSFSAHKFHGPKGVGGLFIRKGISLHPLINGGGQEKGRRAGTENLPGIIGMEIALEEACAHMSENMQKTVYLRNMLAWGLSGIPGSILNGDPEHRHPGNVNFCFADIDGEMLLSELDRYGISASSGSACSSGSKEPSHVLKAIGRPDRLAQSALRLTLNEENTPEEVNYMIQKITMTVTKLRTNRNL